MPNRQYKFGNRYRFGYQGQFAEKDEETGLDHFEARDYDSRLGRWLVPDPAGQHWSPYLAMGNNPVSGIDPDGREYPNPTNSWQKFWNDVTGYGFLNNTHYIEPVKCFHTNKKSSFWDWFNWLPEIAFTGHGEIDNSIAPRARRKQKIYNVDINGFNEMLSSLSKGKAFTPNNLENYVINPGSLGKMLNNALNSKFQNSVSLDPNNGIVLSDIHELKNFIKASSWFDSFRNKTVIDSVFSYMIPMQEIQTYRYEFRNRVLINTKKANFVDGFKGWTGM